MTQIKPSEVSQILKEELMNLDSNSSLEETGTVLAIGDGIARIYGLKNVESGELSLSLQSLQCLHPDSSQVRP